MISEKDLKPGNVIVAVDRKFSPSGDGEVTLITPWLVVAFRPMIKRRHARAKAKRSGWQTLLLRFGPDGRVLCEVEFTEELMKSKSWKRLVT